MKLYSSMLCFGLVVVMVCQPPQQKAVSEFCAVSKPIIASRHDTPETLAQIRTANEKIRRICGK